jgi:hypothetical protein
LFIFRQRARGVTVTILVQSLLLLVGTACDGGAAGSRLPRIEFVRAIEGSEEAPLLCIQGFAPLPRGCLLVSDRLDYRLKVLGSGGGVLLKAGGRGRGAGKFLGPGPVDWSKKGIAAAEFASSTIQTFSTSLVHQTLFQVPGTVADLRCDAAGNVWSVLLPISGPASLVMFDRMGQVMITRPLRHATGNPFADVCTLAPGPGGEMLVTYMVRNIIEVWDTSGRWRRSIAVPGLPVEVPFQKIHASPAAADLEVPEGVLFLSTSVDSAGRLFILGGDYSGHRGRDVYLVDAGGTYVGVFTLPQESVMIRVAGNNRLWALDSRRTSITEYRLVWEKKRVR